MTEDDRRERALLSEAWRLNAESYRRTSRADKKASEILSSIDYGSFTKLRSQLRSLSLQPSIDIRGIYEESQQELAVREVVTGRSELLALELHREALTPPTQVEGSILIYIPNDTLFDGASEVASEGFFDDYDAPPWDSWFHYQQRKLFAWIPSVLIPLAQAGIDANCVQCIEWAERSVLNQLELQ